MSRVQHVTTGFSTRGEACERILTHLVLSCFKLQLSNNGDEGGKIRSIGSLYSRKLLTSYKISTQLGTYTQFKH